MSDKNRFDNHSDIEVKSQASTHLDKDLRHIAGMLADIPDVEPPDKLIESVMARIQPKKLVWWRRIWRQLHIPIYVTPLKIIPFGASAAALILVALVILGRTPGVKDMTTTLTGTKKMGAAVTFTLNMPDASNVEVIGSFNQWTPNGFQMHWDKGRGLWILSVPLENGRYEYAFLVDGKSIVPDPKVLMQQDDGFGNKNSILIIERNNGHET
ncbi:MAG: glycogen-binding domain-containing protein [Desulfobacteraceae bacterium]|nr:MAG: glycogen-binding domain-containing protein [Desulfobacteraceae bacterium]